MAESGLLASPDKRRNILVSKFTRKSSKHPSVVASCSDIHALTSTIGEERNIEATRQTRKGLKSASLGSPRSASSTPTADDPSSAPPFLSQSLGAQLSPFRTRLGTAADFVRTSSSSSSSSMLSSKSRAKLQQELSRSDDFFASLVVPDASSVRSSSTVDESNEVFARQDCISALFTISEIFDMLIETYFTDPDSPVADYEIKLFLAVAPILLDTRKLLLFVLRKLDEKATAAVFPDDAGASSSELSTLSETPEDYQCKPVVRRFLVKFLAHWVEFDPRVTMYAEPIHMFLESISATDILQVLVGCDEVAAPDFRDPGKLLGTRKELQRTFLKLSAAKCAQMLESASMAFLSKVTPSDIYFYVKDQGDRSINPCQDVIDHFNNTVSWIQTTCLTPPKAKKRAKKITFFIDMAVQCLNNRFLSCLLMISTALHHQTISRLRETWLSVPTSHQELFERVQNVATPLSNFASLRKLAAISPPVPLPLSIHTKDLVSLLEVAPVQRWEPSSKSFPYLQLRTIAKLLEKATFQLASSSFNQQGDLESFLANPAPRFPIEKLYSLSYSYEKPPSSLTPETATKNPLMGKSLPQELGSQSSLGISSVRSSVTEVPGVSPRSPGRQAV